MLHQHQGTAVMWQVIWQRKMLGIGGKFTLRLVPRYLSYQPLQKQDNRGVQEDQLTRERKRIKRLYQKMRKKMKTYAGLHTICQANLTNLHL
jgi:hypothetical protein